MFQIISNAPAWAWFVLAGLVVLGGLQTFPRRVSRTAILILPVVMPIFSLASVGASFAGSGAWAAGALAALGLNGLLLRAPRGVRYDATAARYEMPGSWVPLALMMIIFATRFTITATTAVNPQLAATTGFTLAGSAILGFLAGMFVSRAVITLAAAKDPSPRARQGEPNAAADHEHA